MVKESYFDPQSIFTDAQAAVIGWPYRIPAELVRELLKLKSTFDPFRDRAALSDEQVHRIFKVDYPRAGLSLQDVKYIWKHRIRPRFPKLDNGKMDRNNNTPMFLLTPERKAILEEYRSEQGQGEQPEEDPTAPAGPTEAPEGGPSVVEQENLPAQPPNQEPTAPAGPTEAPEGGPSVVEQENLPAQPPNQEPTPASPTFEFLDLSQDA